MFKKWYTNYSTLFISCLKYADHKYLYMYDDLLTRLMKMSSAHSITSVFLDAKLLSRPCYIKGLLNLIRNQNLVGESEITLAISPKNKHIISAFNEVKHLGVNRVCIGPVCLLPLSKIQENFILNVIKHSSLFFNKICVDIIFDLQTDLVYKDCWSYFMKLLDAGVTHVTLQQSTSNSQFTSNKKFDLTSFEQYCLMCEVLSKLGFFQYELCYFALPGYMSIYNTSLWQGQSFIGIGPNAHSRISLHKKKIPNRFAITCTYTNSKFHLSGKKLSYLEVLEELLYLGLRCANGVDNNLWKMFSDGKSLDEVFGHEISFIKLLDENILILTNNCLKMNMNKILLLDSVLIILFQILYKQ